MFNKIKQFFNSYKNRQKTSDFDEQDIQIKQTTINNWQNTSQISVEEKTILLCTELKEATEKQSKVETQLRSKQNLFSDLTTILSLRKEEKNYFKKEMVTYYNAIQSKSDLQDLLKKSPIKSTVYFEDNFPEILIEIQKAEERQQILKNDIDKLEGEKSYLIYEKERYRTLEKNTKAGIIAFTMVLGLVLTILTMVQTFYEKDMTIGYVLTGVFSIFMTIWMVILNRHVKHKLLVNNKTQNHLVQTMNKLKVKYARYKNYVEFEYSKYHVSSIEVLEKTWQQFQIDQKNNNKYKKMSEFAISILNNIENFCLKKNIVSLNVLLDKAQIFSEENKLKVWRDEVEYDLDGLKKIYKNMLDESRLISADIERLKQNHPDELELIKKIIKEHTKIN